MKTRLNALIIILSLHQLTPALAQKPELIIPFGHSGSVNSSAFSSDEKFIVTASDDGTIKFWETSTGRLIKTCVGHSEKINTVSISSNNKFALTSSADKSCKIWDINTGKVKFSLDGHTDEVLSAIYSPDEKYIATSSKDKTAKLWDAETGKLIRSLEGEKNEITSTFFIADGKRLVTNAVKSSKVWDVPSGRIIHSMDYQTNWITSVSAIHKTGNLLALAYGNKLTLWELNTGKLVKSHDESFTEVITTLKFSPDGNQIAIALATNSQVKILDLDLANQVSALSGHEKRITTIIFAPDGKSIATSSLDNTSKIWQVSSGKLNYTLKGHSNWINSMSLSNSGIYLITNSQDAKPKVWNITTGKLVHTLEGLSTGLFPTYSTPDGRLLGVSLYSRGEKSKLQIWNLNALKPTYNIIDPGYMWFSFFYSDDPSDGNYQNLFSLDGKNVLILGLNPNSSKPQLDKTEDAIYEIENGHKALSFDGGTKKILSPNSNFLVEYKGEEKDKSDTLVVGGGEVKLWDLNKRKLLYSIPAHKKRVINAKFSPDSKYLVTASLDSSYRIWDVPSGTLLKTLNDYSSKVYRIYFTENGKYLVTTPMVQRSDTTKRDIEIKLYGLGLGKYIRKLIEHTDRIMSIKISPDNKFLITVVGGYSNKEKATHFWEIESGKLLHSIPKESNRDFFDLCSPDGKYFVKHIDDQLQIWELDSWNLIHEFTKLDVNWGLMFSEDGKYFMALGAEVNIFETTNWTKVTSFNGRARFDFKNDLVFISNNHRINISSFRSIVSGKNTSESEMVSIVPLDSVNWVAVHKSGLFDATPAAMEKLYFASGLDIIEFKQLKSRYFEPGLGKKVMNGEKLRNVVGFNNVELPPDVRVGQVDSKGNLPIEVINRGGGIGEVTLYINGKEVIKDLRTKSPDTKIQALSFSIPVSIDKNLIPGIENYLAVKAWNAGQWIESRGTVVTYTPPTKSEIKPAIHILVCGVSDYTGEAIDLKYAAKDAEDMARALELGAKRLFGADKSYVYTLTTEEKQDHIPNKSNILKAFEKISNTSTSGDVLVVYLSGHGINLGGADGDFYYLTQDAFTASASSYNDPAIRQQSTISSQELVELFKKVPALKQVLMIDACSSGKVVDNLMAKRDIESGTLRALDRMKDRTGMHIITGCTADAVSYEASRYGQGVLTYSLLEGIRGLALREDKFVDVNKLFQFAQDRVPILASGIGGIQSPQVFSPNGSQSFDFGELTAEEKKLIPLSKERPIYIRSNFIDEQKLRDVLALGKKMDVMLNNISARGEASPLFFVDVSEYPDACQLSGLYKQDAGKISFRLNKVCESKEISFNIEAGNEMELLRKVIELINK